MCRSTTIHSLVFRALWIFQPKENWKRYCLFWRDTGQKLQLMFIPNIRMGLWGRIVISVTLSVA